MSILSASAAASARAVTSIQPVSWWENRFQLAWASEYSEFQPKSASADGWDIYSLGYAICANWMMFAASDHDTQYLDRAKEYIDNKIGTAQLSSTLSASQYQDGYQAWINLSPGVNGDPANEQALHESYGWRYVCSLLRELRQSSVYQNPTYGDWCDATLAWTETNIWTKWHTRSVNSNIYRSRTHTASHWARIALELGQITANSTILSQCNTVRDDINFDGMANWSGASLRGQLINHPSDSEAYFWNATWGSFSTPGQDVDHGNAVIGHITNSIDRSSYWTVADAVRLVRLFDKIVWPSASVGALNIDGTGSGDRWFVDGWTTLGRFNRPLQVRIEGLGVGDGTQARATGAMNAKILLGQ